ncbi:MAG: SpoIIE family protein phosphatase, partial [Anaerolineales bacterium]
AFRDHEPAIFLPELTARKLETHPGDTIEIETLNGPVSFYIAGVGGAFPVISPASAVRYFNVHPFGLILEPKPGVDRTQLEQRVDAFIDRHRAEVSRLELEDIVTVVDQIIGPVQALFAGLTSLSGLVAALGIVVTLFASVLERQRELGTLRALGMAVNMVRGLVLMEAGGLGLLGSALGALGGLGMGFLFQRAILDASRALGGAVSEEIVLPWGVAGAALLIGPVVAMLAALYPADRAASVNPANAMRAESATGFLPPAKHLGPTGLRGFFARMPLAAKLSLASGLILVTALAAQTALRVDAERRLLEESLSSLFARTSDTGLDAVYTQIPADVTELTPATLDALQQRADTQVGVLQSQLLNLRGRQMADDFQLRYLLITDLQRRVVLSDPPSWLGRTLTDTVTINGSTTAVRLTDWWGERVFEGTVPIANEAGTRLGYLQVGISTGPVDGFIREVIVGSLWTMALTLLAAITVTVWLTRRALAPVARVAAASAALARGELNQRLPETSWDEGGELTRAFNDMVKGLRERERLEEELRLARHIQQTLLPKEAPRLPGWELAAEYRPARAVGGDFYDWLSLPDGRLAIIIGDVTDKGLPAALVMATTRALLRAALEHSTSPSVALEQVNNLLHPDIPPKMFATCLMAVLDPTTGRLVYANAGHDQPFHRRHSSEVVELRARGMPLGLMPGMRYEEKETCVEPGECVLFYTDGLVEAHNPQREMFGFPRLQARLAGPPLPEGPGLISALLHELAQFAGLNWEQEDDVTLVVLQRAENS